MTDRKLPLPKIPRGRVRPTAVPSQMGIAIPDQPIRRLPGGMAVVTDPQSGVITRDPRSPGEGTRPTPTTRQQLRRVLGIDQIGQPAMDEEELLLMEEQRLREARERLAREAGSRLRTREQILQDLGVPDRSRSELQAAEQARSLQAQRAAAPRAVLPLRRDPGPKTDTRTAGQPGMVPPDTHSSRNIPGPRVADPTMLERLRRLLGL